MPLGEAAGFPRRRGAAGRPRQALDARRMERDEGRAALLRGAAPPGAALRSSACAGRALPPALRMLYAAGHSRVQAATLCGPSGLGTCWDGVAAVPIHRRANRPLSSLSPAPPPRAPEQARAD